MSALWRLTWNDLILLFALGADYNFGQEPSDGGKPVYPTAKGTIPLGGVKTNQCGFGNIVFVRHETSFGTYTSMYAYVEWLTSGPPKEGDEVSPDLPIANIGNGSWNNPSCKKQKKGSWPYHLHCELREGVDIWNGLAYTADQTEKGTEAQIDPNAFISSHR
jgi:murein DD-endopeptidase MepM/ murein hydrolase activator NlpD